MEQEEAAKNLGVIITTVKGRKRAYAIYAACSLIITNTAIGFAAAGIEQPIWLIVATAIIGNLAAPFGALAIANAKEN